jgi:micrococcal nuclease
LRVVDGDTIDVTIRLGFDVELRKQRLRLYGINAWESRTRDKEHKRKGLLAKQRLIELCPDRLVMLSHGRGKYGRILATIYTEDNRDICKILVDEGHAWEYFGK